MKAYLMTAGFALTAAFASPVFADTRDPAAAQALFDEARTLMKSQRYAEACPKLAESQRLDPGIGTLFRLGDCYERQGKVASAWAAFLDVASLAAASNQPERERAARDRASRLEGRLPRLSIVVPPANRAPQLQITRDGIAVGEAQWGSALPVDPGDHQIAVTAPGRRPFTGSVTLIEGTPTAFEVPALEAASTESPSTASPAAAPAPPAAASRPAPQGAATAAPLRSEAPMDQQAETAPSSGPNYVVIGLGGLGVIGVAVGATLGLMARSKFEDSKTHCRADNENLCTPRGLDERDQAFSLGNGSTAGFIIGGAALAGAAVVWFTSGSSKPSQTGSHGARVLRAGLQSTPARTGLVVEGSF